MGKTRGRSIGFVAATLVLSMAMIFAGGCEKAKVRSVNVAAGEYYTEDELIELTESGKGAYCRDLDKTRATVQAEFEAKTKELADINENITALRSKRDQLDRDLLATEAEIRTLNDQISEVQALPTHWRIRIGDSLKSISALPQVYNDDAKWWKLFEANKKILLDPFYCLADTVIVIPRDWPAN
jgi:nucleoid-associated protein YgaU